MKAAAPLSSEQAVEKDISAFGLSVSIALIAHLSHKR
jgi:hypothetical protein